MRDDEIDNWKLEFDFGEDARREGESGEPVDFSGQESLGKCPKTQGKVYEFGTNYVCEHSVGPTPTCDFKSGKVILQQPVAREQMTKLLATGATDLLDGFVSNKTRRKFKARLAWDAKEGKVVVRVRAAAGAKAGGEEGRRGRQPAASVKPRLRPRPSPRRSRRPSTQPAATPTAAEKTPAREGDGRRARPLPRTRARRRPPERRHDACRRREAQRRVRRRRPVLGHTPAPAARSSS